MEEEKYSMTQIFLPTKGKKKSDRGNKRRLPLLRDTLDFQMLPVDLQQVLSSSSVLHAQLQHRRRICCVRVQTHCSREGGGGPPWGPSEPPPPAAGAPSQSHKPSEINEGGKEREEE